MIRRKFVLLACAFLSSCENGSDLTAATVYFLEGERLVPVEREVEAPAVLRSAVEALLAGPTEEERGRGLTTEIPLGTRVLDVSIRDSTAFVDLSSEIHDGGGSLSMHARLAQLVFTATDVPGIERMRLVVDGEPAPYLGGEGVMTEEPLTRERFQELAPIQGSTSSIRSLSWKHAPSIPRDWTCAPVPDFLPTLRTRRLPRVPDPSSTPRMTRRVGSSTRATTPRATS